MAKDTNQSTTDQASTIEVLTAAQRSRGAMLMEKGHNANKHPDSASPGRLADVPDKHSFIECPGEKGCNSTSLPAPSEPAE